MSLLGSIAKLAGKVIGIAAPIASIAVPGVGGIAAGVAGTAATRLLAKKAVKGTLRALPGIGAAAAGTAAGMYATSGGQTTYRRRRRKGITASELRGFKKVANTLNKYFHDKPRAMRSKPTCH